MLKQILVFKVVNDRVMQINVASILVWTMIWEQLFWKVNYYRRVFIYVLLELEVLTDLHNFFIKNSLYVCVHIQHSQHYHSIVT